jgi:hypothetical protein
MTKWTLEHELVKKFKTEVHDKAKQVDPEQEEDWKSLTIGWAIAKGLTTKSAREFALYIRYQTELG